MKYTPFRFRAPFFVFLIGFGVILSALISCGKKPYTDPEHPAGLKPTPTNPWLPSKPYVYVSGDDNLVTLGRVLFYDKNLSSDKSISCGSCHKQASGFADNTAFSTGNGGQQTVRNAHTIMATPNNSHFWDGKIQPQSSGSGYGGSSSSGATSISVPFQSHIEMNLDMNTLCDRINALPYYNYLFSKAFPNQSGQVAQFRVEEALAAFLNNITSDKSAYDKAFPPMGSVITQPVGTLTAQELNGMNIFNGKANCSACHLANNGFGGNVNQFEDIGLDAVYSDLGRGGFTNMSRDNGRFHVPSLKNISLTAPYMHDGRFRSLGQVVDFFCDSVKESPNLSTALTASPAPDGNGGYFPISYNMAPTRLNLTAAEKADLVAFLNTLTDYSLTNDIRFSDPFKH
jgi:cytochrome c peroxidase